MDKSSKKELVNDIENRLDDFFAEEKSPPATNNAKDPLEKLKSLIWSIDWEITDQCLSDMIDETQLLLAQYKDDQLTHTLLRMLHALGRYIRKRKAQSHPDGIRRVMSVYASLEKIILDEKLAEPLKKRIIAKEIQAFKKLKEQVEAQRRSIPVAEPSPKESPSVSPPAEYVDHRKFEQAMSAVEQRLTSEVEALRSQLTSLQKELNILRGT